MNDVRKCLKPAFMASLPVMAGYLVLGFGFGLLVQSKGMSWWWAAAMSIFVYGGSLQFAGVELIASHASLLTIALMSLMIQARHLFYGLSMLKKYGKTGWKKPYLIFSLTDETYSLVCKDDMGPDVSPTLMRFLISLFDQIYWVIGTLAGALLGMAIPFNTAGVDFSMTALFIVCLCDSLLKPASRKPALAGLACSIACLLVFGAQNFLIPSMVLIALVLSILPAGAKEKADA